MADTPDQDELQDLLRRAAAGEEPAWRRIVDVFMPRVFGLIKAQCGNVDLAAEIAQSTFCTVVVKIGGYTEVGRFEAWLFRIAMNRLRDEMRRRGRQARPVDDEALQGLAGADPSAPAPGASDGPPSERLSAAMAQLNDADRRILHLRYFAELTFQQIADVLGQPLGTVLARHHRAIRKLRDLMGPRDGDAAT